MRDHQFNRILQLRYPMQSTQKYESIEERTVIAEPAVKKLSRTLSATNSGPK